MTAPNPWWFHEGKPNPYNDMPPGKSSMADDD